MKESIALHAFHITEMTTFKVESDHALTETLRRYQSFYREAYGAPVCEADLLREMARRFMEDDKAFRRFSQKNQRTRRKLQRIAKLNASSPKATGASE